MKVAARTIHPHHPPARRCRWRRRGAGARATAVARISMDSPGADLKSSSSKQSQPGAIVPSTSPESPSSSRSCSSPRSHHIQRGDALAPSFRRHCSTARGTRSGRPRRTKSVNPRARRPRTPRPRSPSRPARPMPTQRAHRSRWMSAHVPRPGRRPERRHGRDEPWSDPQRRPPPHHRPHRPPPCEAPFARGGGHWRHGRARARGVDPYGSDVAIAIIPRTKET